MRPALPFLALVLASTQLLACGGALACEEVGCISTLTVDYGDVTVDEPYVLTINPEGQPTTVTCLADTPDAEPLPEWLECDAGGFTITGEFADNTTITVTVTLVSTQESVIPGAVVPLTVDQTLQPNGPDCEPTCYVRTGSTQGL